MNDYHEMWECEECLNPRAWGVRPGADSKPLKIHTFVAGASLMCNRCKHATRHTFVGTKLIQERFHREFSEMLQ